MVLAGLGGFIMPEFLSVLPGIATHPVVDLMMRVAQRFPWLGAAG